MRLLLRLESWFGDCGNGDDAAGRDGTRLCLNPKLGSSDIDGEVISSTSALSRCNGSAVGNRFCIETSDVKFSDLVTSCTVAVTCIESSDRTYMGTNV